MLAEVDTRRDKFYVILQGVPVLKWRGVMKIHVPLMGTTRSGAHGVFALPIAEVENVAGKSLLICCEEVV